MEQQAEIEARRKELKEEISAIESGTSLDIVYKFLSRFIPRFLPEKNPLNWLFQVILINTLILIPGLLLSAILNDFEQARDLWMPSIVTTQFCALGFIVARASQKRLFNDVSNHIVRKIKDAENLEKLIGWLKQSWSMEIIYPYILLPWIVYGFLTLGGVSYFRHSFIGFSSALMAVVAGFFVALLFHYVVWITLFEFHLRDYQYDLNALSPADSEIIIRVSGMSNIQIYILAAFFSIFTLSTSLGTYGEAATRVIALPFVLLCWILIALQFLMTRSTIHNIVERARWKILNKLQMQINQFVAEGNLADQDASEKVLRLSGVFNQIRSAKTGILDLKSVLILINQLLLPIFGLLLGNLVEIINDLKTAFMVS